MQEVAKFAVQQVRLHFKAPKINCGTRRSSLKQATAQAGEKKGTKLELLKVLSAHTQVQLRCFCASAQLCGCKACRVVVPAGAGLAAELAAPPRRWWRAQTTSCCCPWRTPATRRRTLRSPCMVRKGLCCLHRLHRPVGPLFA